MRDIKEVTAEILAGDETFRLNMLGRLANDCDYYLGFGGRSPNVLWAKNVENQIKLMRAIHKSLEVKPKVMTLYKIEKYRKEMIRAE